MHRLGVVSFLNARPLIEGLGANAQVEMVFDVPAALPALLDAAQVDAALVPIIDVIRSGGRYRVISDACIGCDGETMTVRVFSQIPPDRITHLAVDGDSHTSVALATVLWHELYGRRLDVRTIDARRESLSGHEAVLLIGDKVVDPRRSGFAYEVDLGGAWRAHTGLPFVFAAWAVVGRTTDQNPDRQGGAESSFGIRHSSLASDLSSGVRDSSFASGEPLAALLSSARDTGVAAAARIARDEGPAHGWPPALAERYLTHCLSFRLDVRAIEGANLFAGLCAKHDLAAGDATIPWPDELRVPQVTP